MINESIMEEIITRTATIEDMRVLLLFEQGVIAAERPFDSTLKNDPVYYYDIAQMIASPEVELIVAVYNGQLIASGYARIEEAKPYLRHRQHAYLGFMYVIPGYRGRGVNKKIIAALTRWALSKNIHELKLDVYYDNEAAIKAYEKVGFSKYMIAMRKPVE